MTQSTINAICNIVFESHKNAGKLGANCKLGTVPNELSDYIFVGKTGTWNLTEKGLITVRISKV